MTKSVSLGGSGRALPMVLPPSRPLSEEDRQWFMEAMQGHTIDSISRMKQISQIMKMPEHLLDSQGVTTSDLEGMLDELQEHVESIDLANGL
ncbi:PREDICTED: uncharacterized protein LOC106306164 isoform X2 [Brassica oleracea var. oleracea]|nr:PREDICTED: uncharacterized protein LOC106306164 isoform X2 [Brassica oleracea var. oleracea]